VDLNLIVLFTELKFAYFGARSHSHVDCIKHKPVPESLRYVNQVVQSNFLCIGLCDTFEVGHVTAHPFSSAIHGKMIFLHSDHPLLHPPRVKSTDSFQVVNTAVSKSSDV
jgi:hypothetical protein